MQVIEELWAWVSTDDEGEGVLGHEVVLQGRRMMMPMVGADRERMESLREVAQDVVDRSGTPARLVRFTTRTEHETLSPSSKP